MTHGFRGERTLMRIFIGESDSMIDGGLITLERVRVILYRPHSSR